MQFCKQFFLSSQFLTIFAGVVGSWFFILILTVSAMRLISIYDYILTTFFLFQAMSNLEAVIFGTVKARWFPEVFICLLAACFACSTIHRVAVTTCLISSFIGLYYVNKASQRFHLSSVPVADPGLAKKKKK